MVCEGLRFFCKILKEMFFNALRIRKKFDSNVDINGKVVVITGANTGIGKVTARELARLGAKVIIGCRDVDKGNKAVEEIKSQFPYADIRVIRLDLSSLASVRQFAKEVCEQESQIDILINNAGVAYCPKSSTEDGFETHFGTNYLGHFLLTHLLLKPLTAAPNARIVNVSSVLYMKGKINFDDINLDNKYDPEDAYAQSKLAIVLFTRQLARKLSHTNVNVYCLHPGIVRTDGQRHVIKEPSCVTTLFLRIFFISAGLGAQTTLYCALEPSLSAESGHYYSDCTRVDNVRPNGTDDVTADRLWQLSNDLVHLEKHLIL